MTRQEQEYLEILRRELVPALGCTEPIAIAYGAARCRALLGAFPTHMTVSCSGNIIKNVMGVIVPTTGDLRGIDVSALLGALAGDPARKMEVLSTVTPEDVERVKALRGTGLCTVKQLSDPANLHLIVEMEGEGHRALVEIVDAHTNIVREERDGQTLYSSGVSAPRKAQRRRQRMTVAQIDSFARTAPLEELKGALEEQVRCNLTIAEEGLRRDYGVGVGRTLLSGGEADARRKAVAYAAAGSDARMSGCVLPVVVNSGSGNQGMTVSLPVIVYAREMGMGEEPLYRALALSNLVAIYQKSFLGELSAYCGVVSAACGSAAGLAYLCGEGLPVISDTIINTIGTVSGMICDGAKPSCAAKIAAAVEAGFLALDMARRGHVFHDREGLVQGDVDATIAAFGRMGRQGMRGTDREIIRIMVGEGHNV